MSDTEIVVVELTDSHIDRLAVRIGERHPHVRPILSLSLAAVLAAPTQIYPSACDLLGWSVFSGVANNFALTDGHDGAGQVVGAAFIAATSDDHFWMGPQGARCFGGLTITPFAAGMVGAVYVRPLVHG